MKGPCPFMRRIDVELSSICCLTLSSSATATNRRFLVDIHPGLQRPLRIACVTETYPPEVNGVAMTIARLVQGIRARHHVVQVVRPRQGCDVGPTSADGQDDVLVRGVPIPRYAGLRMGLPCKSTLVKLWTQQRPDVVHIATEGPLGRSALLA